MNVNLQQTDEKTISDAQVAYHNREITAEQFREITRIPMKDLVMYENGFQTSIKEPTLIHFHGKIVIAEPV
jgi:hypothetical protein